MTNSGMHDPSEHDRDPSPLEAQLTAYLDDELPGDERQRVEELISHDPAAREQLRRMNAAWGLLDELPRAEVDESFTHTTVEMIAVTTSQELDEKQGARTRRRGLRWGIMALAILASGLAGYAVTAAILSSPNEQLVHDLPVIENMDSYRNLGDFEFLQLLEDEDLFDEEPADDL